MLCCYFDTFPARWPYVGVSYVYNDKQSHTTAGPHCECLVGSQVCPLGGWHTTMGELATGAAQLCQRPKEVLATGAIDELWASW